MKPTPGYEPPKSFLQFNGDGTVTAVGKEWKQAYPILYPGESMSESVNHPQHYGGDTPYEAIKVIEAWSLGFCLGNAVKYISRAGKKDQAKTIEDLEKAKWYLDREIASRKDQLAHNKNVKQDSRMTPQAGKELRDLVLQESYTITLQPPKKECPNCGEHVACPTHADGLVTQRENPAFTLEDAGVDEPGLPLHLVEEIEAIRQFKGRVKLIYKSGNICVGDIKRLPNKDGYDWNSTIAITMPLTGLGQCDYVALLRDLHHVWPASPADR